MEAPETDLFNHLHTIKNTFLVKLEGIKPLSMYFLIYFINVAMRGSEVKYFHVWLFNSFHNLRELEV